MLVNTRNIHDVAIADLLTWWQQGLRHEVVHNLSQRHPAITAWFCQKLFEDDINRRPRGSVVHVPTDLNVLINSLMDDLTTLRDQYGLEATEVRRG
jgi:hypothetical protein